MKPVYSGMMDATRKTIAQEGLAGLYKGVASPLVGARTCTYTLHTGTYALAALTQTSPLKGLIWPLS